MTKFLLGLSAGFYGLTGLYLLLATDHFYATVPGVEFTGPLNHHFAYDVAFAMLVSGALILWALRANLPQLAIAGAAWPALHGAAHIFERLSHPQTPITVATSDVIATVLPALLTMFAAARFYRTFTERTK